MANPTHRRTSSDKKRRASHFALKKRTLNKCKKCNEAVMPHRACSVCGTYAGKQVLKMSDIAEKIVKKAKKKENEAEF